MVVSTKGKFDKSRNFKLHSTMKRRATTGQRSRSKSSSRQQYAPAQKRLQATIMYWRGRILQDRCTSSRSTEWAQGHPPNHSTISSSTGLVRFSAASSTTTTNSLPKIHTKWKAESERNLVTSESTSYILNRVANMTRILEAIQWTPRADTSLENKPPNRKKMCLR